MAQRVIKSQETLFALFTPRYPEIHAMVLYFVIRLANPYLLYSFRKKKKKMGCTTSNDNAGAKNSGFRLISSKLHFKLEQLDKLNDYFRELAKSDNAGFFPSSFRP